MFFLFAIYAFHTISHSSYQVVAAKRRLNFIKVAIFLLCLERKTFYWSKNGSR
jgi:hypothetical protein